MTVIRPIETNMSLYNVEMKASEVKDPNASQFQAAQQQQTKKEVEHQAQSIQPTDQTEGEVKIRDNNSKREQNDGGKKKKNSQQDEAEEEQAVDRTPDTSRGFSFLA